MDGPLFVTSRLFCTMSHLILFKTFFSQVFLWRGTGGWEPGRTGGGRGTGDGRRKGRRRDLYDGRKRERNSKTQAFAICYCLLPVKETNPRTFLDFHLTFSEAYSKILYTRKVKKRKFVLGIKKNGITSCEIGNLSKLLTS